MINVFGASTEIEIYDVHLEINYFLYIIMKTFVRDFFIMLFCFNELKYNNFIIFIFLK